MKGFALGLVFSLAASSWAQSPARPSGARVGDITGRVIGEDGQPIARAQVEAYAINAKAGGTVSAGTDAEGHFKLSRLPPASYILRTSIPGYVTEGASRKMAFHRIGEHVTLNLNRTTQHWDTRL